MKRTIYSLLFFAAAAAHAATSVSQYGITWTFNADYTVGQYWNGDYYVVAPSGMQITNISPASTLVGGRAINGSMANPMAGPGARHGFDSSVVGYTAALNVARPNGADLGVGNPLVVAAGTSIVSSISHTTAGRRPVLTDGAILTVVAVAPATATKLRPPYCGTDKSHNWDMANIDYSILKNLAPVNGSPTLASRAAGLVRPRFETDTVASGRYIHPSNNQPDYGEDIGIQYGDALLALHLNYSNAEKELLYGRMAQIGLDIYGAIKTGGVWTANGGHDLGRKMPMILAGLAFNDSAILAYANAATHFKFQEDQQTFYVDEAQLLVVPFTGDNRLRLPYTSDMLGRAEWGEKHSAQKTRDGSNWSAYYRDICARVFIRHALAAHLTTGAVAAWNRPVFFDYADRAKSIYPYTQFGDFTHGMWVAYRNPTSGAAPAAPTGLSATPTANRLISLSWTPPAGPVDYYIVERSTASGSGFERLAALAGNVTTFSDPTPLASVPYYYRIRAGNGSGDGANSAEASATPTAPAKIRVRRGAGGMNNN